MTMEIWEITKGSGTTMNYEEIVTFCEFFHSLKNFPKDEIKKMCMGLLTTALMKQWTTFEQDRELSEKYIHT